MYGIFCVIYNPMNKFYLFITTLMLIFSLQGCSVSSDEVIAVDMSTYPFRNLTCDELDREMNYLRKQANLNADIVDDRMTTQGAKDVAAFLFFWPALPFIDTNAKEARKYAELKGEFEAAKRVFIRKGCSDI